jgi:hypothetical protein
VVVVVTSSCDGNGDGETAKVEALLSGGGGSGHIMHPVMGDPPPPPLGSLAPDLDARVLVGLPCSPT